MRDIIDITDIDTQLIVISNDRLHHSVNTHICVLTAFIGMIVIFGAIIIIFQQ